jgi:hypothetical protein
MAYRRGRAEKVLAAERARTARALVRQAALANCARARSIARRRAAAAAIGGALCALAVVRSTRGTRARIHTLRMLCVYRLCREICTYASYGCYARSLGRHICCHGHGCAMTPTPTRSAASAQRRAAPSALSD